MPDLASFNVARNITVPADPAAVYEMIADVTRVGEWSPVCKTCTWDGEAKAVVGAWFTGTNATPEREWQRPCQVEVADPGQEFAWRVGGLETGVVRWGYRFSPVDGGTQVEETWRISELRGPLSDMTDEQAAALVARTVDSIETTLANLRAALTESS